MRTYSAADGKLQRFLEQDFGLRISNLKRVADGDHNEVYSGVCRGKEVFIRMTDNAELFSVEAIVHKMAAAHGVPCPKILKWSLKPLHIKQPTMVEAAVPGSALGKTKFSPAGLVPAYRAMGQTLKKIHSIPVDGFGHLQVKGQTIRGKYASWKDFWTRKDGYSSNVDYVLKHGFITKAQYARLQGVFQEIGEFKLGQAWLSHGDYHDNHIFFEDGQVTGIIDWSGSEAGDPRSDVAEALFHLSQAKSQAFKEGYGEGVDDPAVQKYLQMVAVWKVTYRHKYNFPERMPHAMRVLKKVLS